VAGRSPNAGLAIASLSTQTRSQLRLAAGAQESEFKQV
jgi:hypothetical protein